MSELETINALITDTDGAATRLGVTVQRINQLVKNGHLPSLIWQEGRLIERNPSDQTRGKDLFFLQAALDAFQPPAKGRKPTPGSKWHGYRQKHQKRISGDSEKLVEKGLTNV